MNDPLQTITEWDGLEYEQLCSSLGVACEERRVCPFLGAGISRAHPANLPLAGPLVSELVSVLDRAFEVGLTLTGLADRSVSVERERIRRARLEQLLDALYRAHGPRALDLIACLNGRHWNMNHAVLAALAQAGFLPTCVTLNFDLLIEYAIARRGASCMTVCPLLKTGFATGDEPHCTRIVKPHGSFTPPHVGPDAYSHLSATLSQAGTRPSLRNRAALDSAFDQSPVLLVAGYSDDDWDIFPIVQELTPRLRRVVWVEYAASADNAAAKREALRSGTADAAPHSRVVQWLRANAVHATLLFGRVDELLGRIAQRVRVSAVLPSGSNQPPPIDASAFAVTVDVQKPQSLRTLTAVAGMTRNARSGEALLHWLQGRDEVRRMPELTAQVNEHRAHAYHTAGAIRPAIKCMFARVRQKETMRRSELADDYLWIGYEFLCLAKRPQRKVRETASNTVVDASRQNWLLHRSLRFVCWLLEIPENVWRGAHWMNRAITISRSDQRASIRARAQYYWADLLHSWGNLLMLCGPRGRHVTKPLFRLIASRYHRVHVQSPEGAELMLNDYFWMRHLESRILASGTISNRLPVLGKLDEIAHRNRLVQDDVQTGNTHAYKALILFLADRNAEAAALELDKAEAAWSQWDGSMAAGRRRVALFRRFIGQTSFREALNALLGE